MGPNCKRIANRFRGKRAESRLAQADVAQLVGVSPSTVGYWETNGSISLAAACAAADVFGCSLDELAGRDWPPRTA